MTTVPWILKHPRATMEMLGYIPDFLHEENLQPAREQFDQAYKHGGGWSPTRVKFRMMPNGSLLAASDPDYPLPLLAEAHLRKETIRFYQHSWVAIVQEDGTFEICRMD